MISFFGVVIPVCAPRSGHPAEGTSDAAKAIPAALAGLDLPESVWGRVRLMVTNSGKPYVYQGMVCADVAERMAEAMRAPAEAEAVKQGRAV
ncbi:hypothetical protein AB0C98_38205 [Streptomyces sp. NPDC048558]|uniref:hypothetical protein n=1 Tax=Streptomyces sp. NPDC048558 TaxID=3155759 RepID=UPI00343CF2AC